MTYKKKSCFSDSPITGGGNIFHHIEIQQTKEMLLYYFILNCLQTKDGDSNSPSRDEQKRPSLSRKTQIV